MSTNQYRTHKDLVAWQKAMGLAAEIHRVAPRLPRHELFGLASQMKRAAVSIPSNIAEGAARRTTREFLSFLYIARGSAAELETQLLLVQDLGYLPLPDCQRIHATADDVGRLLSAVILALHRRLKTPSD
jgi:four helix bundle protein